MAILNRLKKINISKGSIQRYLFYAVGEVLLIFVGITLSIWFSNWNESKRDRETEVNILKELRDAISRDTQDIRENIQIREKAKEACIKILSLMENPTPYHDTLDVYFANAFQLTGTNVESSAYENLKSRGLHTISNDNLRVKIIDLYDLKYKWIHDSEARHDDLFFSFLVNFNSKRFDSPDPYGRMKPIDYTRLMKDQEYKYYLKVLIFYNDFILGESRDILEKITALTRSIDTELTNLE